MAESSSTTPKDNDINTEYLTSLIEMGISNDEARQALALVENRSLEEAIAIIFGDPSSSAFATNTTTSDGNNHRAIQTNFDSEQSNANRRQQDEELNESSMYKMLFVVNGSLKMSSGKMCAQVAHCAIDLYQQISNQRLKSLNFWIMMGQSKIVVRGNSAEELIEIEEKARQHKSIVTSVIQDAGRTEIPSSSITCLGLFGTNMQLDPLTGHLKLMHDCLKCSNQGDGETGTTTTTSSSSASSKKSRRGKQKLNVEQTTTPTDDAQAEEQQQEQQQTVVTVDSETKPQ